jgi:hypothetical protein
MPPSTTAAMIAATTKVGSSRDAPGLAEGHPEPQAGRPQPGVHPGGGAQPGPPHPGWLGPGWLGPGWLGPGWLGPGAHPGGGAQVGGGAQPGGATGAAHPGGAGGAVGDLEAPAGPCGTDAGGELLIGRRSSSRRYGVDTS